MIGRTQNYHMKSLTGHNVGCAVVPRLNLTRTSLSVLSTAESTLCYEFSGVVFSRGLKLRRRERARP